MRCPPPPDGLPSAPPLKTIVFRIISSMVRFILWCDYLLIFIMDINYPLSRNYQMRDQLNSFESFDNFTLFYVFCNLKNEWCFIKFFKFDANWRFSCFSRFGICELYFCEHFVLLQIALIWINKVLFMVKILKTETPLKIILCLTFKIKLNQTHKSNSNKKNINILIKIKLLVGTFTSIKLQKRCRPFLLLWVVPSLSRKDLKSFVSNNLCDK